MKRLLLRMAALGLFLGVTGKAKAEARTGDSRPRSAATLAMKWKVWRLAALVLLVGSAGATARADPDLIPLPSNFTGEGLAVGTGSTFYVGSLGSLDPKTAGEILIGDLRTGTYHQFVAPDGLGAAGDMHFDPRTNLLYVARSNIGGGTVYDATTGAVVRSYQFNSERGVNDQVITPDAVYFTDSRHPYLYRVPLGPDGQPGATFETIPLPANFGAGFGANGIAATADGRYLIVGHTSEGNLYRIDTSNFNDVRVIDYGGPAINDGLLLEGHTLYDVQNFLNRVAVIHMSPDFLSGEVTGFFTEPFASNPAVRIPTSIARSEDDSLYVVTGLQGFPGGGPSPPYVARLGVPDHHDHDDEDHHDHDDGDHHDHDDGDHHHHH